MTRVTVLYSSNKVSGLRVEGHSRKVNGDDVCMAVSLLTDSLAASLSNLLGVNPVQESADGFFKLEIDPANKEANLLLAHTILTLRALVKKYPNAIEFTD